MIWVCWCCSWCIGFGVLGGFVGCVCYFTNIVCAGIISKLYINRVGMGQMGSNGLTESVDRGIVGYRQLYLLCTRSHAVFYLNFESGL